MNETEALESNLNESNEFKMLISFRQSNTTSFILNLNARNFDLVYKEANDSVLNQADQQDHHLIALALSLYSDV